MTKAINRIDLNNALYLCARELADPPLSDEALVLARRAAWRYPRRAWNCYQAILRSHGIRPVREAP